MTRRPLNVRGAVVGAESKALKHRVRTPTTEAEDGRTIVYSIRSGSGSSRDMSFIMSTHKSGHLVPVLMSIMIRIMGKTNKRGVVGGGGVVIVLVRGYGQNKIPELL